MFVSVIKRFYTAFIELITPHMPKLTSQSSDFPQWYLEVIDQAGLAEHSSVKGSMIIKPYGFAIWELMQRAMDDMIKEAGVQNAYFPLLIPKGYLDKEADHVEGFAPEVAWVTKGGGKDLEEPLAIRPTSETTIGEAFARWTQSYRDLPIKINQWANVVRWELRPRLFLRTSEFLWQEGHTIHATADEAREEVLRALAMYKKFINEYLAMEVIDGYKPASERFAGAVETTCVEALMKDGKALQMGTSHDLGQNFARAFNIQYLDAEGKQQYAYQTSWGTSTRMIGGLIMAHGDDSGLRLPPKIAPIQIVIVPIWKDDDEKSKRDAYIQSILKECSAYRVHVDWDETKSPGWKFNEWEVKGVPIRIEVGNKETEEQTLTLVRRDTMEKQTAALSEIGKLLDIMLKEVHNNLISEHKQFTENNTKTISTYNELIKYLKSGTGFVRTNGSDYERHEDEIKKATSATIRVLPFSGTDENEVLWAKAY